MSEEPNGSSNSDTFKSNDLDTEPHAGQINPGKQKPTIKGKHFLGEIIVFKPLDAHTGYHAPNLLMRSNVVQQKVHLIRNVVVDIRTCKFKLCTRI